MIRNRSEGLIRETCKRSSNKQIHSLFPHELGSSDNAIAALM